MKPPQTRACPICAGNEGTIEVRPAVDPCTLTEDQLLRYWTGFHAQRVFFPYVRCAACGMLYNRTYLSDEDTASLYSAMEDNMAEAGSDNTAATQHGYVDLVSRCHPPRHDYLEIGPDTGVFAGDCMARGMVDGRLWFCEPNREVWDRLGALGGQRGSVELAPDLELLDRIPTASVGIAVAIHVMDHVVDPIDVLRRMRRVMVDGGVVLVVVHNERSLMRRALGGRWPPFRLQHPHLFSPTTLQRALETGGFGSCTIRRTWNAFDARFLLDTLLTVTVGRSGLAPQWLRAVRFKLPLGNIAGIGVAS